MVGIKITVMGLIIYLTSISFPSSSQHVKKKLDKSNKSNISTSDSKLISTKLSYEFLSITKKVTLQNHH